MPRRRRRRRRRRHAAAITSTMPLLQHCFALFKLFDKTTMISS